MKVDVVHTVGLERSGTAVIYTWMEAEGLTVIRSVPNAKYNAEVHDIIVLRSLLNWWASRAHWLYRPHQDPASLLPTWEQHARACLKQPAKAVKYDSWVKSKNYREEIMRRFGRALEHDQTMHVPQDGWGSSFADMDVLQRYKLLTDEHKQALPEHLLLLDREIFGDYIDEG